MNYDDENFEDLDEDYGDFDNENDEDALEWIYDEDLDDTGEQFLRMMDEYDDEENIELSEKINEFAKKTWTDEELLALPHEDYLLTPHWLQTAAAARKRAGYKCDECGKEQTSGETLHVHHRTYKNKPHEKPEDLQVLCWIHHREKHLRK